jgi:hypothetical protein
MLSDQLKAKDIELKHKNIIIEKQNGKIDSLARDLQRKNEAIDDYLKDKKKNLDERENYIDNLYSKVLNKCKSSKKNLHTYIDDGNSNEDILNTETSCSIITPAKSKFGAKNT